MLIIESSWGSRGVIDGSLLRDLGGFIRGGG
jgi:hypothetical protein